ncbi:MAG: DUF1499 domain-containing protein [Coleofasciculaceae cyanobacterium]
MTADTQSKSTLKLVLVAFISIVLVAISLIGATLAFSGESTMFAGNRPTTIGVQSSGELAPCPGTPNCVNSKAQNAEHAIEPLSYNSNPEQAMANLKTVIENMEKTTIIASTNIYLYAEFKSKLIGFVDDVEFLLDEKDQVIQVRSASRLGKSDLGVNRKRIEAIRSELSKLQSA